MGATEQGETDWLFKEGSHFKLTLQACCSQKHAKILSWEFELKSHWEGRYLGITGLR